MAMKTLLPLVFLLLPGFAAAATGAALPPAYTNVGDTASLQRGAKLFVNYCLSCHSARFMRYSRLAADLDLTQEQVEKNLLVERLIRERILGTITISEEDLKRSYEENLEAMSRPEGVEANHIFVKISPDYPEEKKTEARKKMATVVERLAVGEDFKALARIYSEDASAAAGGSIGTVYKGQTIPEFETALFSTTEGAVSGVIESSLGLHLLQVTRKIPPGPMPFEEVKAQLSESLRERRSFEAIQAMVDSLRSKAKVEIF